MFVDQDHECAKEQAPLPENARVLWQSFLDPDGYMYYLECDQGYQYLSSNEGLLFCNMTTGQWDDHHAGNCTEAPYESTTPSSLTTILYEETTIEAEADTTLTSARNALTSSTPPFASTSTLKSTATSFDATTGSATAPSDTTQPGAISGAVTGETDTIVPLAIGLGLSGLALFIIVIIFLFTLRRRKKSETPYTTYPAPSSSGESSEIRNWNPSSLQDLNVTHLPDEILTTKKENGFFNSIHGYIPKILADKKYGFKESRDNKFITYVDVGKEGQMDRPGIKTLIIEGQDTLATLDRGRPRVRPTLSALNPVSTNIYTMDPTLPKTPSAPESDDPAYESLYAESINPVSPRACDDYIEHSNFASFTSDRCRLVPKIKDPRLTFM